MYTKKTPEKTLEDLLKFLPQGQIYRNFLVEGDNMNILMKAFAKMFKVIDDMLVDTINGLEINENCPYLDQWYEELGLNRFIVKPKDKALLSKIILAFLRARQGIFSAKEMEDFIYDIFGITIKIDLLSSGLGHSNTFEATFEITFYDTDDPSLTNQYSVIIWFPKGSLSQGVNNPEDPYTAIRNLLTYFININYKIFFRELEE